jgi:hypothetical protein
MEPVDEVAPPPPLQPATKSVNAVTAKGIPNFFKPLTVIAFLQSRDGSLAASPDTGNFTAFHPQVKGKDPGLT